MKKTVLLGVALWTMSAMSYAQDTAMTTPDGKIGNMTVTAFQKNNEKGNAAVAAITPTSTKLIAGDKALLLQIAKGGMMQLLLSQQALNGVQSPEAKLLAQSEVEEQTGVAAKLKEIAEAKGITIPDGPDAMTTAAVDKLTGMSGEALDAFYVKESGVKGHVKLKATMSKVLQTAKDASLNKLAIATMPVIRMHLAVSTAVSKKLMGSTAKM